MKVLGSNTIRLGLFGVLVLGASLTYGQTSDNVVGIFNMTIQPGDSYVAFPYQKPAIATGIIAGNDQTIVTVATDSWQWKDGFSEPGQSTFYLEISNGSFEGWLLYIDTIEGDTITLADLKGNDLTVDELAGASFKVIPANRIRDLFGEPGAALLSGGPSHRKADTITRWNGMAWHAPIYVNTIDRPEDGRFAGHWYCNGEIADDTVIGRDEAVHVKIRGDNPISLRLVGEVSQNAHATIFEAGLHLVGGASCTSENLADSDLTGILKSAKLAPDADNLFAWQQGWSAPVFHNSEDGKWYQGETEADSFQIKPAQGYMVLLREPPVNNVWRRQSPLSE